MKKLKLIYNPFAGDKTFVQKLDSCIAILQSGGYDVHVFRSIEQNDISRHIANMPEDYYDTVVVSGGDGTINIVLNSLIKNDFSLPMGIIPSGTANDFASYLKIPRDVESACKVIIDDNIVWSDVGQVNSDYFINVCAAGFFSNISQAVDPDLKNKMGKLAYYLKGIEQLTQINPFKIRIRHSDQIIEEDILLFIILNGTGAGGLTRLSGNASINDGKFDFLAFKNMPLVDLAVIFYKLLRDEHLNDERVIYFQDSRIEVEPISEIYGETDIDGETGPSLPVTVTNLNNRFAFFAPSSNDYY